MGSEAPHLQKGKVIVFDAWLPPWMVTVCVTGVLASMFWRAWRGPQKIGARLAVVLLGIGVIALLFANGQEDGPALVASIVITVSFGLFLILTVADYVWIEKNRHKR